MRYHHHAFDRSLLHVAQARHLCMRYAVDLRAKLYEYESRFFEDPATPDALAAHLGLSLPAHAGAAIFRALERGNVEAHIARMDRLPGILQDRVQVTGWTRKPIGTRIMPAVAARSAAGGANSPKPRQMPLSPLVRARRSLRGC